jgi:hypothetical protein
MMAPRAAMGMYWNSHDSVGSTHSTTTHITCPRSDTRPETRGLQQWRPISKEWAVQSIKDPLVCIASACLRPRTDRFLSSSLCM